MFVFPAVAFVLFATDIPFVMNMYYSVFDWNGVGKSMKFVGLDNFIKIFTNDKLFWKGVTFTLKFAVFYVVIVNIISLTVAVVMSKEKKSSSVGRAFYYVPYIISLTAISLIWKFIFGPGFEALYNITGWEFFNWSWVGTPKLAFYVVVIMAVWQNVGFYMVNYIAGIIAVPRELTEAAKIDGAGFWRTLTSVTFPMVKGTTNVLIILGIVGSLKTFDIVKLLTNGGPGRSSTVMNVYLYEKAFKDFKAGEAAAIGVSILIIAMIMSFLQVKFGKED